MTGPRVLPSYEDQREDLTRGRMLVVVGLLLFAVAALVALGVWWL